MDTSNFTSLSYNTNGNPRYVCHFVNLLKPEEKTSNNGYAIAVRRAKAIGGKKYHNKTFGGGIVFQSYNTRALAEQINSLTQGDPEPTFVNEWTRDQFIKMEGAIMRHFKQMGNIKYRTGDGIKTKIFASADYNFEVVDTFLGCDYTSSSSYAGYWICNVQVLSPEFNGYHYNHFALSTDGIPYVVLSNDQEKELFIKLV